MKDSHIDPKDFYRFFCNPHGNFKWSTWRSNLHLLELCPECLERVLGFYELESIDQLRAMTSPWEELKPRP